MAQLDTELTFRLLHDGSSRDNVCNKCGNGVCAQTTCHWSFPHTFGSVMIICNGCFDVIDNKLINYDHLLIYRFLKKNVRTRRVSC